MPILDNFFPHRTKIKGHFKKKCISPHNYRHVKHPTPLCLQSDKIQTLVSGFACDDPGGNHKVSPFSFFHTLSYINYRLPKGTTHTSTVRSGLSPGAKDPVSLRKGFYQVRDTQRCCYFTSTKILLRVRISKGKGTRWSGTA